MPDKAEVLAQIRRWQEMGIQLPGVSLQLPLAATEAEVTIPQKQPPEEETEEELAKRVKRELNRKLEETNTARTKLVRLRGEVQATTTKLGELKEQEKEQLRAWKQLQQQATKLSKQFTKAIEKQWEVQGESAKGGEG